MKLNKIKGVAVAMRDSDAHAVLADSGGAQTGTPAQDSDRQSRCEAHAVLRFVNGSLASQESGLELT